MKAQMPPRRRGPEPPDAPPPRPPADSKRQVKRQRPRRDGADRHLSLVAHPHHRALAEIPLDLPERDVECLLPIHFDQPPSAAISRTSYWAPPGRSRDMKTA